uniref:ATPase AAA-type core domain-containing protein n=1 Tax=Zooxanthella nutricula TaxID=1333877 RepID=A0A7S2K9A2_9DINO
MIGEPPIIFLDEPSAGMDPVARRHMWDVIQETAERRRDSAVVLTTHSMEEADALCSRIAIQASGQVRCLGTPQQLKEWHGTGLELNVRLEVPQPAAVQDVCRRWGGVPQDTRTAGEADELVEGAGSHFQQDVTLGALAEWKLSNECVDSVTCFLRERCADSGTVTCVERAGRTLSFRLAGKCLGGGPLPYGELFDILEGSRERLHFADFQLSQGTLERTFNRLAAEDLERVEATQDAKP